MHRSRGIESEKDRIIRTVATRWQQAVHPPTLADYHAIGSLLNGKGGRRQYGAGLIDGLVSELGKGQGQAINRSSLYKAARFAQCCTTAEARMLTAKGVSWRTAIGLCDRRVDDDRRRIIRLLTSRKAAEGKRAIKGLLSQNRKVDRKTLQAAEDEASRGIKQLVRLARSGTNSALAAEASAALGRLTRIIPSGRHAARRPSAG